MTNVDDGAGVAGSTDSELLRNLTVAALMRQTDAGPHVYHPDDWPVQRLQLPAIQVDTQDEVMQSRGRMGGIPQFITSTTVEVSAYVQAHTKEKAKAALNRLAQQIKFQVLTSNDVITSIQQFQQVKSTFKITAEGQQHTGIAVIHFEMEYPQEFWPDPEPLDLEEVVIDLDTAQPFDATGTYTSAQSDFNADFPNAAQPAPRTSGPDGRLEGRIKIQLPQN
jgi:hypothetical protein